MGAAGQGFLALLRGKKEEILLHLNMRPEPVAATL